MEFEAFAREHGRSLTQAAYLMCGNREQAEDAAQIALEKVFVRWRRLDNPVAYARRIVITALVDDWRRYERHVDRSTAPPNRELAPPNADIDTRDSLTRALSSLPRGQRQVVVLRYWFDLSEKQTAEMLNVKPGTVKSQASRALAALRPYYTKRSAVAPLSAPHDQGD